MINRIFDAMFTPKYPKGYTGRHRAQLAFVQGVRTGPRPRHDRGGGSGSHRLRTLFAR